MSTPPSVARDPRVIAYVVGATVSQVGDQVWLIALAFGAAQLGDPFVAALVIAVGTLPRILLALWGGVLADRVDTRRIVVGVGALQAAVLSVAALVSEATPQIVLLIAVGLFLGATNAFHDPAMATLPRQLVTGTQLIQVASFRQLGGRVALIAGAPLGGLIVGAFGIGVALGVDAAAAAIAAVLFLGLHARYPREPAPRESHRAALGSALRYVRGESSVTYLLVALTGLNVFVTPVTSLGLALRATEEDWGAGAYGIFLGLIGAGAAVGTLIPLWWKPPRPLLAAQTVLAVQALALVTIGVGPDVIWVGAATTVVGLTAGIASPLLAGSFQAVIARSFLGRVSAILALADDVLLPIALSGFGLLASGVGTGTACAIFGGGMGLLVAAGLLNPAVRSLRAEDLSDDRAADAT